MKPDYSLLIKIKNLITIIFLKKWVF